MLALLCGQRCLLLLVSEPLPPAANGLVGHCYGRQSYAKSLVWPYKKGQMYLLCQLMQAVLVEPASRPIEDDELKAYGL